MTSLTLAMCQSQNSLEKNERNDTVPSTKTTTTTTGSTVSTTTSTSTSTYDPKTGGTKKDGGIVPPGLPPDPEAMKRSEQEAAQNSAGIIYLKEGENKFLKEYEMNVTFKKISADSRCPVGVQCIWAGVATAEIEVMGLATRPTTVSLSTLNDGQKGFTKSRPFNGYQISLVSVTPEPTAEKGTKALAGNYKIGIKITKDGTSGGTTTR